MQSPKVSATSSLSPMMAFDTFKARLPEQTVGLTATVSLTLKLSHHTHRKSSNEEINKAVLAEG